MGDNPHLTSQFCKIELSQNSSSKVLEPILAIVVKPIGPPSITSLLNHPQMFSLVNFTLEMSNSWCEEGVLEILHRLVIQTGFVEFRVGLNPHSK